MFSKRGRGNRCLQPNHSPPPRFPPLPQRPRAPPSGRGPRSGLWLWPRRSLPQEKEEVEGAVRLSSLFPLPAPPHLLLQAEILPPVPWSRTHIHRNGLRGHRALVSASSQQIATQPEVHQMLPRLDTLKISGPRPPSPVLLIEQTPLAYPQVLLTKKTVKTRHLLLLLGKAQKL